MYTRENLAAVRVKKEVIDLFPLGEGKIDTLPVELGDTSPGCTSGSSATLQFPYAPSNLLKLNIVITMKTGVYQGGAFTFFVEIPSLYPFYPPVVTSVQRIWHPAVDLYSGRVQLPILADDWRPVLTLNTTVLALQLMLLEPSGTWSRIIKTLIKVVKSFLIVVIFLRGCPNQHRGSSSPQEYECFQV